MGEVKPVSSLAMQEKREMARPADLPHLGQTASSSDWLIGRSISNFEPQLGQMYS
jgi:hypothetical protein